MSRQFGRHFVGEVYHCHTVHSLGIERNPSGLASRSQPSKICSRGSSGSVAEGRLAEEHAATAKHRRRCEGRRKHFLSSVSCAVSRFAGTLVEQ